METELLIVGSVALDTIETRFGRQHRILGGSASFASVAASLFVRPSVCAVVGEDFPNEHIEFLASRGIDLSGLGRAQGETFYWCGRYAHDFKRRETLETRLNVFADFRPALPREYRRPRFLLLGNIHPSLQLSVLDQVERPAFVACDTMNLWIETTPKELKTLLGRVDAVLLNDEEALQLAGEHDLLRAARYVRSLGPSSVVVKRGDAGAMLLHDDRLFVVPAFPVENVRDPTGAGDSFAGGFLGALGRLGCAKERELRMAMVVGSVVASFAVEDFGLGRFRTLSRQDVEQRLASFKELVAFADPAPLLWPGDSTEEL